MKALLLMIPEKYREKAFDWVINQGVAVALLIVVAGFLRKDIESLSRKCDDLQSQFTNYILNDNKELQNQLQENTMVLKEVKNKLENGNQKK
jgi:hypothetical protein